MHQTVSRAAVRILVGMSLLLSACDSNRARDSGTVTVPASPTATPPQRSPVVARTPDRSASLHELTHAAQQSPATPQPRTRVRPPDRRPVHDVTRLSELGIHLEESKHLKLYSDIEPAVARTLPPLIDQLSTALEAYFGPMPPDPSGMPFQMSGYLMRDMGPFREAGLLPQELLFDHGQHRGNEFWMRDQKYDYYRRHLLIHEATHCFMTYLPETSAPVWYLEGMAELFGVHQWDGETAAFRLMPTSERDFAGFARISTIRDEVAAGQHQTIAQIFAYRPDEFLTVHYYAWSWGLCAFLDHSPRYRDRFRTLGQHMRGNEFVRQFDEIFAKDRQDLEAEWTLFAANVQFGYDFTRAAIDFRPGVANRQSHCEILADRGWQSTAVQVQKDQTYLISATGQFTLGIEPKPWLSEPQGISFRYFDGRPIGMLLGCIRGDLDSATASQSMRQVIPIGRTLKLSAPFTGTLYLRLNDAWNSLSDNQGSATVTMEQLSAENVDAGADAPQNSPR